ncbi:alpha/beta fold hydrolase [Variovorax paradoxus]|uniref:alpha/beta hydrolase n=1 Tax=Variovorax paradoxus TaxID=34073 RepID=UPI0021AD3C95|nr:alpha/beta fold hydrolase [Variovorax paradoxus]UVH55110.1 alpha/beta fold hydrolase [Variovorax paradoxus]
MKMKNGRCEAALAMLCALFSGCALQSPPPVLAPPPAVVAASPPPRHAPVPVVAPPSPTVTTPKAVGKNVKLWYGTNRKETEPFVRFDPYGSDRDRKLNFGVCEVLIPASHERGSLGSYSRFQPDKDAPLIFTHAQRLSEEAYWGDLTSTLKQIDNKQKVVLVFIHGYNNSFADAALRTAQLWADLNLQGVPAFFSWPSRSKTLAYTADEATIEYSEKYLAQFLVRLREEVGDSQPIHVIAHSMGNRALLRVAARLQDKLRFGQVILAAPDVDADLFQDMASAYPYISERTTLYVSKKDKPVHFSRKVHDMDRVGAPPGFAKIDRIDTVEVVAKTGLLELGHSYFAEFSPLLDEIGDLISRNLSSDKAYFGNRVDHRADCIVTDSGNTKESCWRIIVNN